MSNTEDKIDLETSKIPIWREAIDAAGSSAIGFLLSLIYTILIVRVLPQTEVGIFFFYLAIVFLITQITKGVGAAIRKRVSSVDDNRERSAYLWVGFILIIPIVSILVIGLYIVSQVFGTYLPFQITASEILATLFATIGVSTMQIGRFQLSGSGKPGRAERYRVFIGKLGMVLITGLVFFYPTAEFVLISRGIGYGLSGVIMLYLAPNQLVSPTKEKFIEILNFAKWSIPTNVLNDFYHRWDTILLGVMVGAVSISYYDSSVRLATVGFPLMAGISAAANVKLSGLYESNKNVNRVFRKLLVASNFCTYPVLLVFFFSGDLVLKWTFGAKYTPATALLFLLAVQQVFQSFRLQFEALFNSFDIPKKTTKTSLLSVIINVITAPLLVLRFGMLGVIYSTLIAEVTRIIVYEYQAYNETNTLFVNRTIIIQPLLIIGIAIIIKILTVIIHIPEFSLFIISSLGIVVFYVSLYYLSPETRKIMTEARKQLI